MAFGRSIAVHIIGDTSGLDAAYARAMSSTSAFGKRMSSAGRKMTLGVTAPIVGIGAAAFKMADDYDRSMTQIETLTNASAKDIANWRDEIMKSAPELGRGPRELGEALYFAASSGVEMSEVMDVVKISAKAATVGLGDTETVVNALTSVINAYGAANMDATRAANVMVGIVAEGKGEADEFAPILGNLAGFASRLGVSFEDVGGALAGMTQIGTTARQSGTQLQAFFSTLIQMPKAGRDELEKLGLSYGGLRDQLKKKGLVSVLKTLDKAFDGNIVAMRKVFPNIRGLRLLLSLPTDEKMTAMFKRMNEGAATLGEAFAKTQEKTGYTMDKMKASLEVAMVGIGGILAPVVEMIATYITRLSMAFQNLSPGVRQVIIVVAALAAAIGPVLLIVGAMASALAPLAAAFLFLISPVGLIIAAVALLVGAFAAAIIWPDKFKAVLMKMGLSAKDAETIIAALQGAFQTLKGVVMAVMPVIKSIVTGTFKYIQGVFNVVMGLLQGDWSRVWEGMKQILSGWKGWVVAFFVELPKALVKLNLAAGKAIIKALWEGIKDMWEKLRGWLLTKALELVLKMVEPFSHLPKWLGGGWAQDLKAKAKVALEELKKGADEKAKEVPGKVGESLDATTAKVRGHMVPMRTAGASIGDSLVEGIASRSAAAQAAGAKLAQSAQYGAEHGGSLTTDLFRALGASLGESLKKGLESKYAAAKDAGKEMIDKMIQPMLDRIEASRSRFESAFGELTSLALEAFDEVNDKLTKSEKELAQMEAKREAQRIKQAVEDASDALTAAEQAQAGLAMKEGETPEEYAARQKEAADAVKAAQKALDDALYEQKRVALQRDAEQERKDLNNRLALKKKHFGDELTALQNSYNRGKISAKEFHERLVALFKEYHVPYKKGANALGLALAEGLNDAWKDVDKAARSLANTIVDTLSQIRVIINVDLSVKNPAAPGGGKALGGSVYQGRTYVVGERGPELFAPWTSGRIIPRIPRTSAPRATGDGGGVGSLVLTGPTINVNVGGSVISERDLADHLRNLFLADMRRKGYNYWGGSS